MSEVIYADVLIVLNIYVTYLLLSLTGIICRKKSSPLRFLLSSVLSGIYSLIILVPDVSNALIAITKIPLALLLVYTGFGFTNKRLFLRLNFSFLAVSFAFAGVMLFIWFFFAPGGMYYNNGIVYFNIDTMTLVVLTVICYVFMSLCHRFIKTKAPINTVYDCVFSVRGKAYSCHCFLDTGNSLCDPYDGTPVIIVTKDKFNDIVPKNDKELISSDNGFFRLIPCFGISGEKLLLSFKSDSVRIKGIEADFTLERITVALAEGKIHGGAYDGILPNDIFLNKTEEKGADFEYEHQSLTFKI